MLSTVFIALLSESWSQVRILVPPLHFPVVSWVAVRLHLHLGAWPSLWPCDVCASCDASSEEAFGGCGSDHLWLLSVPGQQFFIAIRPVLFLPTLSSSLPPLLADTDCCGSGDGAAKAPAPTCVGAFAPSPAGSPASTVLVLQQAWGLGGQCNLLMEGALGLSGWPAALPRAIGLLSGVPKTCLCEWDSVPCVVLSSGLAWCPQMYVLLTSSWVVSIGLLFQEKWVSRVIASIDLADDMGRRNKGIKPLSDLPRVRAEACSRAGGSMSNAWCALAVTLPVEWIYWLWITSNVFCYKPHE